ncbi:MAG: LysR family transcriptional regulator [Peptococcaceae bacterium]|nr:LysR family transcriptional regulator [Peptococcaceae bacterium]
MRLEQLQYFVSIAKNHSISKTSMEYYTTHQNISKAIRQLENEFGVTFFTRSVKGMTLTPEGELFLPSAILCINEMHKAKLQLQYLHRNQYITGCISLLGTTLTNTLLLPTLLNDFSLLYPNVRYEVHTASPLDILRTVILHKNKIGIAPILHSPEFHSLYAPYIQQIHLYPLQQDEFICLVSKNSPLAERTQISLREFASLPVTTVMPDIHENHPINQLLQRFGNTDTLFSQSPSLIAQAITCGRYACLATLHGHTEVDFLRLTDNEIVIIPFSDDLSFDIQLITSLQPHFDESTQAFINLTKNQYPN